MPSLTPRPMGVSTEKKNERHYHSTCMLHSEFYFLLPGSSPDIICYTAIILQLNIIYEHNDENKCCKIMYILLLYQSTPGFSIFFSVVDSYPN